MPEQNPTADSLHILLIEDDRAVASYIKKSFSDHGHAVECESDGGKGLQRALAGDFSMLIVDRMLPVLDGLSIVRELRASGKMTPLIILSALDKTDDRVKGLRAGGDDYLVKPFDFNELLARAEVLVNRHRRQASAAETTLSSTSGLQLDLISRMALVAGVQVELQAQEFRLLEYLMRNKGRVVTRAMLLEHVWEYHFDPQTNVIDVHISRLRGKIDRDGKSSHIKTVRGTGYTIEE